MQEELLVRIYGDSLSLPRTQDQVPPSTVYSESVREFLVRRYPDKNVSVFNRSVGGATIGELFANYKKDNGYFGEGPTLIVIQSGVVDCAPRPVPLVVRKLIGKLPGPLKKRVIKWLHDNRARLLNKGILFRLTDPEAYRKTLVEWIKLAQDKSLAILVVNIAPTNDATEDHSPRFKESILLYNQIIKDSVTKSGSKQVQVIDVFSEIESGGVDSLILADGHHLTVAAHKIYSEKVCKSLDTI